jgi:Uma2 family endonuclease
MPLDLYGIDEESTVRIERHRRMSLDEFARFCTANPDWQIEQTADGEIIIMPPAWPESSYDSLEVSAPLRAWAKRDGRGKVFESSAGFELPNGATRSPDAAWVRNQSIAALSAEQRKGFFPLCPDFVVEVQSQSDSLARLKHKMQEWIDNGAQLGWLIQPDAQKVHIYRVGRGPEVRTGIAEIEGEGPVAGFVLDLTSIWAGL